MDTGQKRDRFWARAEPIVPIKPGVWGSSRVRIFEDDIQIGEYERNYPGYAEETFEAFEWDGAWFALYSPDYTSTRVMTLPDCKDVGGEEPAADGFCPVEFYVPRYRTVTTADPVSGRSFTRWQFSAQNDASYDVRPESECGPWVTIPTGFIAGCQWGDDQTWKLECIDLALASLGQIVRTARFGHVELARGNTLASSLNFDRHPPDWDLRMTLIRQERRDVATGTLVDPYDE